MNKAQLVECVALEANLTKKVAAEAVDAVFTVMTKALKEGDTVKLVGFGNFTPKKRAARTARNPMTGEDVYVPESKTVTFKASKALKE